MTTKLQVLSAKELAPVLGICAEQIRRMAKQGRIPHQRTGDNGKFLFSVEAINQWLKGGNNGN